MQNLFVELEEYPGEAAYEIENTSNSRSNARKSTVLFARQVQHACKPASRLPVLSLKTSFRNVIGAVAGGTSFFLR